MSDWTQVEEMEARLDDTMREEIFHLMGGGDEASITDAQLLALVRIGDFLRIIAWRMGSLSHLSRLPE